MPGIVIDQTDLMDAKKAARAATVAPITLSGTQTVDGVVLVAGDRVLVKDQAAGAENGVYSVAAGAWSRVVDASDDTQLEAGVFLWVREGTANGSTAWFLKTVAPIVLATTVLVFEQFAASDAAVPHTHTESDISDLAHTPDAHAASHENGGSDEISVAGLSGELVDPQPPKTHAHVEADITDLDHLDVDAVHTNVAGEISAVVEKVSPVTADVILIEDSADTNAKKRVQISNLPPGTPSPHNTSHENGGGDEISVAGLSGELADSQPPKAHNTSHQHGGADEVATGTPGANAIPKADGTGKLADGWVAESNVTQHEGAVDHDALSNFAIAEHRIINDAGASTIETWSASKIDSELSALAAGVDIKAGVDTTATGDITLSGEQTLNGLLTSASRVLVTAQSTPSENGIYVSAAGAWARAADADQDAEVTNGNIVHVLNAGSTKYKFKYILVTADPITVGVTAQAWEEHKDIDFGTTTGTAAEGNDSRIPSQDENDALVGTSGTPSSANKYTTADDPVNTNARTPTAHTPSHLPSGSDPLTTAAAGAIAIGDAAAVGAAESFARSDHKHSLAAPAAPANVTKAAAAAGSSPNVARQDHKHDVATAAPSQGVGGGNSEGTSTSVARSDHDHALRTTTGPTDLTVGAVADGEFIQRSGSALVGASGPVVLQTKTVPLTTDETTTSAIFVTLLSTTITVAAGSDLIVMATVAASNASANKRVNVRLMIDGTASKGAEEEQKTAGVSASLAISGRKDALTVGSKTVTLQWEVSAGTGQCEPVTAPDSEHATLTIFEVTG